MRLFFAFLALTIAGYAAAQSPAGEAAIRNIVQKEIDTWNRGDAVGYSKDFATNGTFTNVTAVSGLAQPPNGVTLDEKGRIRTRLLQIVAKENGAWKIVTYHNTDVKPGILFIEP